MTTASKANSNASLEPRDGTHDFDYNPTSRQWSIYWSNSAAGTLDRPMIGEFRDGRGEFFCQEELDGRAILQRFIWTSSSRDECRWEQAYSMDGGASWETNWIMEFTRAS